MGSRRIHGVWFQVFANDHLPPHVHARYGRLRVIVELLPNGDVIKANRPDSIRPANGSRVAIRHTLRVAAANYNTLMALWEALHG